MLRSILFFWIILFLFSSCHNSEFHRTHYPHRLKNKAVHFSTHAHFESNQNTGEISSGIETATEQKFEVAPIDSKLNNSNIAETEDGAL